ncbi:hypothetical protein BJY04DRAFT_229747 [Aspergillus karnatakaensis]|uniref:uncharacterized protein n=1 Tax=Aspergillus karnatakaensis TaxID=1810916 RepID=UPI003CCE394E
MGFFFCPRLRRYGGVSDSSDSVASYQLDRIESLAPAHEFPEDEQSLYHPEGGVSQSSWRSREHEHRLPPATQGSHSNLHGIDLSSPPSKSSSPGSSGGRQQAYTTSADSLTGCPPQISVRKRRQRRRKEIAQDEQSVHLGEMNISRMLASSGSTSQIMIPQDAAHDDNPSTSNTGTWNTNRYQAPTHLTSKPPIWVAPTSPMTPEPSIGHDVQHDLSRDPSGNIPSNAQSLNTEHAFAPVGKESQALRSKFTEKFGWNRTLDPVNHDSYEDDNVASPRKISIGWMSEGRRIGYGYELVPPEHAGEEHGQNAYRPGALENCGSVGDSPMESLGGSITERTGVHRSPLFGGSDRGLAKGSESSFDISTILQKLNLPRWTGANFALRTSNNSDAGSCESGGSSLFNILTNRKKPHAETDFPPDAENPWEFCSWVRPVQTSSGQQVPQQDGRDHAEAELIEKLTTLRRRGGAWSTKRKVSEIARNLEKRADRAVARLAASTEQYPVVQRTATRVLRLRGPGCKSQPDGMHDSDPIFSVDQLDGPHENRSPRLRPSEQTSSGTSDDWDSLYEECLEEHSIPE